MPQITMEWWRYFINTLRRRWVRHLMGMDAISSVRLFKFILISGLLTLNIAWCLGALPMASISQHRHSSRLIQNPNITIPQALTSICWLPQDIIVMKLDLFKQYLLRYVMFGSKIIYNVLTELWHTMTKVFLCTTQATVQRYSSLRWCWPTPAAARHASVMVIFLCNARVCRIAMKGE